MKVNMVYVWFCFIFLFSCDEEEINITDTYTPTFSPIRVPAVFEGLILFILLNYLSKKDSFKIPGIISSLFVIFYSFFRFILEFFREPDLQIGYLAYQLTTGQFISILFFFFGIFLYLFKRNEN